jgi:hypothetical protein
MTYRVELTDRAARDLATLYADKNAAESIAAARWYNGALSRKAITGFQVTKVDLALVGVHG